MIRTVRYILAWLFLLTSGGTAVAQGGFNPDNPPDPFYYEMYQVTLTATSNNYTSGGGKYKAGTTITIRTSASSSDFKFVCWKDENGDVYSTSTSFTYTVEEKNVAFHAEWEYSPANPSDPQMNNDYRLYLTTNLEGSCSFNRTSGAKVSAGQTIIVTAYPNQYYVFQGWYDGEEQVGTTASFNYTMPERTHTLEARFVYNFDPDLPGDPSGNQDDVDNGILGDVNKDGLVNIADVTALVNIIQGKDKVEPYLYDHEAADVNKTDGVTDADVTVLVNMILGKNNRRPYQYNRDVVNVEAFEKVTAADVKAEMNTILRE